MTPANILEHVLPTVWFESFWDEVTQNIQFSNLVFKFNMSYISVTNNIDFGSCIIF